MKNSNSTFKIVTEFRVIQLPQLHNQILKTSKFKIHRSRNFHGNQAQFALNLGYFRKLVIKATATTQNRTQDLFPIEIEPFRSMLLKPCFIYIPSGSTH